ncbi:unnamed protein product [Durusdinium trenchii]|uniref:Uncharacterized protein n=1 Tax=Durusdinium trenchii TaxID=1381693 RepID=A0ABP0NT13_9DINO
MDEVGLLCTWLLVYGSAAWFLNTPSLQEAYANCLPFFGLDHRLQRKVWQHRQKFTPTWIVVFLKTFEVYNLIYLLLRLCFPAGWSTPMSQDWQLCPNLLGLIFIRWSCQPAAQAPQACLWIQRLNSSFSVFYSLMCQVHYPHELQHGLSLICLAVHLFIGDPWFGLALRVAMMPLGVGLRMGGWMRGSKEQSLEVILFLMNEAMSCFFFLLILKYLEFLLGQLQKTATDLEEQMERREQDTRETQETLLAARRLLSVTCDCCEQLTETWEILEPSQSILALLQIRNPEEDLPTKMDARSPTLPLLPFIWKEDQERFALFLACSSQAPSSLHLRMKTCHGHSFEAQLFHVDVPGGLIGTTRHLIGMSRLEGEMHRIPEHCPLVASPFLERSSFAASDSRSQSHSHSSRERRVRRGDGRDSSSGRSFEQSPVRPEQRPGETWRAADVDRFLKQIDYISLQLHEPCTTGGFPVRSVQLIFRDPPRAMDLKNWVARKSRRHLEQVLQGFGPSSRATEFRVPGLPKMRFEAQELQIHHPCRSAELTGPLSITLDIKSLKFL